MNSQLCEAWRIHDRINRYVVERIVDEDWGIPMSKTKGVGAQFAHIVNVRRMWVSAADTAVEPTFEKLDEKAASRAEVLTALDQSGDAILALVEAALREGRSVKNFKPSAEAFVGYLISHESAHRAMAELALRQAGRPLPDKVAYGQWEWGSRAKEL